MLVNMTVDEWDAVIRVHLRGTFCPVRHAAEYWRERSKAGETNDARVICTSSTSGIYGNVGQTNYGAAKAGIAAFVIIAAMELQRYGVTVNAIAPAALTRMTENLGGTFQQTDEQKAQMDPQWVANVITWLASPESKDLTGRVVETSGIRTAIAEGWRRGPNSDSPPDSPAAVGAVLLPLLEQAAKPTSMLGI
jgi:NAD(P)-dependent dehydrogenase (short-subunit alcohol dehydrogenase family)